MANKDSIIHCFMDGTDWQWHLGEDANGTKLYPSTQNLEESGKGCLEECGIAEVEVRFVKWVRQPKW